MYMIFDDELWYQPGYLMQCGVDAEKHYENQKMPVDIRKAIEETRATAIWAFGQNSIHKMELLVQPVNEDSPDTRVMFEIKSKSEKYELDATFIDVEVTRYEIHSKKPLDQFLLEGKLKKAYEPGTIILVAVDRNISNGIPWENVAAKLQQSGVDKGYDIFFARAY